LLPGWNRRENVSFEPRTVETSALSHAVSIAAMKIQITFATKELLTYIGGFVMTERGSITVKVSTGNTS
jgi:hypothetical protein